MSSGVTNQQNLYDVGLGFSAAWQPKITSLGPTLNLSNNLSFTGTKFRGVSEASGGGNCQQNSSSDCPVVQLIRFGNEQTLFLSSTNWQTNSFSSLPVTNFAPGYALLTVFVNGIPGTSSILRIAPTPTSITLINPKKLASGDFQFAFTNTPGAAFTILTSTNVALERSNWTALGNAPEVSAGQFQFSDSSAATNSRRFYSIRSP